MLKNKFRIIYMIIAGMLISLLFYLFIPQGSFEHYLTGGVIISILVTIAIWEGNLRLDAWLNRRYPWISNPARRVVLQGILSFIYSSLAMIIVSYITHLIIGKTPAGGNETMILMSLILSFMISLILLSFEVGTQFFRQWKTSLTEVERYKAESLQAQLRSLKSQVNPHFLFNNLSVLSSLVYKDPDKAVGFIDQLAKVYRYALDSGQNELSTLQQELKFLESYVFLIKIRFESGISVKIETNPESLRKLMPPMALQLLIENAIKHNEASTENPLLISIIADEETLVVSNLLQPRKQREPSSGTGLNNIMERYRFFTARPVEVLNADNRFTVKLPLLISR